MVQYKLPRMQDVISRFSQFEVLVIGDVILDRYWWGEAHRLSPEAPVPVLLKSKETLRPGGAANTAANIVALGARARLVGIAGEDREGGELTAALARERIEIDLVRAERPTTTKTRLIAGHQHIVRVDDEVADEISNELAEDLLKRIRAHLSRAHAVVFSDYGKGVAKPQLLSGVIEAAKERGVRVFIDPKARDAQRYRGAALLKPNRLELGLLTGQVVKNHEETVAAGKMLGNHLRGTDILVTEGGDGMSFFGADGGFLHKESKARQVFDITGAGDTVLAAYALSSIAGANAEESMKIASAAAGISIATVGAATVGAEQLRAALDE